MPQRPLDEVLPTGLLLPLRTIRVQLRPSIAVHLGVLSVHAWRSLVGVLHVGLVVCWLDGLLRAHCCEDDLMLVIAFPHLRGSEDKQKYAEAIPLPSSPLRVQIHPPSSTTIRRTQTRQKVLKQPTRPAQASQCQLALNPAASSKASSASTCFVERGQGAASGKSRRKLASPSASSD